ncbi:hypothetical protein F444_10132 [Phytophthora nicotianae P1976]|uniref:Uncharacterized protein n=1 Tax=Phytophthora nicotianae P1976 TaxID=1317066 RepID=A0A081A545_PHYNI|nr:hypothetical protein F444_10132 [Phytophthora nicotianae P1976]
MYHVKTIEAFTVKEVHQLPELILVRVHDCEDTMANGYPPGVIGIPVLSAQIKLSKFKNLPRSSITVRQFAVVPAFSCNAEKLQGKTCKDGVTVTPLERPGIPTQSEYVALSRTISLNRITLTEEITPEYMAKFKPPSDTAAEMIRLQSQIQLPPYIASEEKIKFEEWQRKHNVSVTECVFTTRKDSSGSGAVVRDVTTKEMNRSLMIRRKMGVS